MKNIFILLLLGVYSIFSEVPKFINMGTMMYDDTIIFDNYKFPCPVIVDWDDDGDNDILLGVYRYRSLFYFENRGSTELPFLLKGVPVKAGGSSISFKLA